MAGFWRGKSTAFATHLICDVWLQKRKDDLKIVKYFF